MDGFDDYTVALASVAVLSTLAELGTGKYAMRAVPAYVEAGAFGLARGYLRFSGLAVLAASVVLALGMWFLGLGDQDGAAAMGAALLMLPVMALVGVGAEAVQAHHATRASAVITRLAVPGVSLAALACWAGWGGDLGAGTAVGFHALGWSAGLVLVWVFLRRAEPVAVRAAAPESRPREWLLQSLPFLGFALLLVGLTRSCLLVLEVVSSPREVALFAAALETGSMLALLAKATDKMFLPPLSVLLERRDTERLLAERKRRLTWVGSLCVGSLVVMTWGGRELLSLFGPGFEEGYPALLVIAFGTAVWTLFSLAPSYLNYVQRQRFVLVGTGAAVVASITLTWVLGARLGSLGAALAFSLPLTCLYLTLALVARRDINRIMRRGPA